MALSQPIHACDMTQDSNSTIKALAAAISYGCCAVAMCVCLLRVRWLLRCSMAAVMSHGCHMAGCCDVIWGGYD